MHTFDDLIGIIAELRSDHGCPWDKEQTFESLKKCLADEAQEVFEAVDNKDMENLCEELGDVLLQVVLYSQIAVSYTHLDVYKRQYLFSTFTDTSKNPFKIDFVDGILPAGLDFHTVSAASAQAC